MRPSNPFATLLLALALLPLSAPAGAQTIVVDEESADCQLIGRWADNVRNGYSSGGAVGNKYHYTSRVEPPKTGREQAVWTPDLPREGRYLVEVSYRTTSNRSGNVQYRIKSRTGVPRAQLDQRKGNENTWGKLGTFVFEEGRAGTVTLTSDGGARPWPMRLDSPSSVREGTWAAAAPRTSTTSWGEEERALLVETGAGPASMVPTRAL